MKFLKKLRDWLGDKPMKVPGWLTDNVLGLVLGGVMIWVIFSILGPQWGLLASIFLVYEGWTLVNEYPKDTLSESVWRFAKKPFIPWLFGIATAWAITAGFLTNLWAILFIGWLQGHFFFPKEDL